MKNISHILLIVLPSLLMTVSACTQTHHLTVIDAGHTITDYGATSCTDKKEIVYNDELVLEISKELTSKGGEFLLTRTADCDIIVSDNFRQNLIDSLDDEKWQKYKYLYSRIALANQKQAGLFISIHHDSVQEYHLLRADNGKIIDVQGDFKQKFDPGYSIYVAKDPKYPNTEQYYLDALKFAKIFAKKMQAMGRNPSTYHEEKPGQENYQSIDMSLGIYNSKTILAVLRNAKMPAVLIEAGVIVDVDDEKIVSSQVFREQFAMLLVESIDAFFGQFLDLLL